MYTGTNRAYVDLNTIYPSQKIESQTYYIDTVNLTEQQVLSEKMRNLRDGWLTHGLKANFDYKRLVFKGKGVMMSDTPMERNTNINFVNKANGDVIIFGLGMGLIILPLLSDEKIKSITVVELHKDLIELVEPILKPHDKQNKLKIVQGDCFNYLPEKQAKFDTIYFDIWIDINQDNYEDQKLLERRFRKFLNKENPNHFMDSWMKYYYKALKRK